MLKSYDLYVFLFLHRNITFLHKNSTGLLLWQLRYETMNFPIIMKPVILIQHTGEWLRYIFNNIDRYKTLIGLLLQIYVMFLEYANHVNYKTQLN